MSGRVHAEAKAASKSSFTPVRTGLLAGSRGNQLVSQPPLVQTKLIINQPNDRYEQEADRVAEQVMAAPAHTGVSGSPPHIQRYMGQATGEVDTVPASVDRVLASSGTPLEPMLRQDMGQRFGHDFSRVRVHSGMAAEQSTREVNANAYTAGHNVVFGAGRFEPETHEGQRLIAHELAHVVQQSGSDGVRVGHAGLRPNSPRLLAHIAQQSAGNFSTTPTVQRQTAAPASAAATGGLTEKMLKQIARTLREAMEGWGTDEEAIYSAFSGRTQEQVDAIARVYKKMYSADLLADLRDELTDSEMKHLAIFSPTAAPGKVGSAQRVTAFADQVAHQLNKAMDRLGTDEDSIYSALTGRTQAELQAIKGAYKRLTGSELEADIRDEMSGSELTYALALLNQGMPLPAKLHLFADIDVKDLGFSDLTKGNVGHTWVSLEYKDPTKVPTTIHPAHKTNLRAGGKYSDPMGFWPAIYEDIGFSVNPFSSWVKGWMRHPDRAHQGKEKATETWDINKPAVDRVIKYAESKRSARYSVYSYNCTDFAKEAVEASGKSAPSMTSGTIAMPNAAYDGIKARQEKGIGKTSVKDFDTGKETVVNGPDETHKKH
ncbi:MAG: DUF4157 domain-containing protein [Proteobacteria bacterium]|nr:DUF4157 domain-containing protein [Pseudomonadota bacterium]